MTLPNLTPLRGIKDTVELFAHVKISVTFQEIEIYLAIVKRKRNFHRLITPRGAKKCVLRIEPTLHRRNGSITRIGQ